MVIRTGWNPSKRRVCLMAAGSLLIAAGPVLALVAEEPALASERFEAPSLSEPDAVSTPAAVASAEAELESTPVDDADEVIATGDASYYGSRFAGKRTASGETFDPTELTAAHRSLPFGTNVKVTNQRNGRSVVVRINDRGPFHSGRLIDLSREAAQRIGLVGPGHGRVELALAPS